MLVPDELRKLFRMVEEGPYLKRSSKGPLRIDLRRTRRELAAAIWRLRQIRGRNPRHLICGMINAAHFGHWSLELRRVCV